MEKMKGYAGSILKVDLSSGSINKIPLTEELIAKFLGGAGINARLAYDAIAPGTEPFSPQNTMVFGVGPLVGTLVPGAGRSNVTSKSPSSRFIGTSGSGHLGVLKFAGYDHVVITGQADRPVYLAIGDKVAIREAGHLWGKDTWATTDAVWQELGRQYAVLAIGPAGENLVRDAGVIANKHSAYARTGIGAVMGSKNLKAIAAYGSQGITVAHPKRFLDLANKLHRELTDLSSYENIRKYGTLTHLVPAVEAGLLSYKNFRETVRREMLSCFDVEKLMQEGGRRHLSCFSCPLGCKHYFCGKEGEFAGLDLQLGCALASSAAAAKCGVVGWLPALKLAEMCNRLGMDYISIGALTAMAIELYERKIITGDDTGGLTLAWDAGTLHRLTEDIANRRGFGDVLANGLMEASRQVGRGAEDCAMHFKGISAGDPRLGLSTLIFSTLINVTGHPSHGNALWFGVSQEELLRYCQKLGMPEKDRERILTGSGGYSVARLTKWAEDYSFVLECLGVCNHFIYQEFDLSMWSDLYSSVTGIDLDVAGLLAAVARGRDMRRAFNMREGATRKDDTMPNRFFTESIRTGGKTAAPLDREHIDGLITEYYAERGWDPREGALSPGRMAELTGILERVGKGLVQ